MSAPSALSESASDRRSSADESKGIVKDLT
jgi:hypothetical protein